MYQFLIIDDEPLARRVLEKHMQAHASFQLVASVNTAIAALEIVSTHKIDLIFLDIRMPVMDGLQFARSLKDGPAIIYTTAFAEHAAESYNLDAIDYLVKPISPERLTRSIEKFLKLVPPAPKEDNHILVKHNDRLLKVKLDDILWIESRKDYMMLVTKNATYLKHITMKAAEELLLPHNFKRVHRSFLVAMNAIEHIGNDHLSIKGQTIPIGEKFRKELMAAYRGDRL